LHICCTTRVCEVALVVCSAANSQKIWRNSQICGAISLFQVI